MAVAKQAKRVSRKRGDSTTPASSTDSASLEKSVTLSDGGLPNTVLMVSTGDLRLIAERVADVPELYDRVCRQLREFNSLGAVDETPEQVVLERVDDLLVVKGVTFQSQRAADRFWETRA